MEMLQRIHSYVWRSDLLHPRRDGPRGPEELRKGLDFSAKDVKAAGENEYSDQSFSVFMNMSLSFLYWTCS